MKQNDRFNTSSQFGCHPKIFLPQIWAGKSGPTSFRVEPGNCWSRQQKYLWCVSQNTIRHTWAVWYMPLVSKQLNEMIWSTATTTTTNESSFKSIELFYDAANRGWSFNFISLILIQCLEQVQFPRNTSAHSMQHYALRTMHTWMVRISTCTFINWQLFKTIFKSFTLLSLARISTG